MKKTLVVGIIIFLAAIAIIFSRQSFYSKETVLGRVWKTIYYAADNQLALAFRPKEVTFSLDVPFNKQEHRLSCEVAALEMALDYYGINTNEDELIEHLNFDTRESKEGQVWGDPENGFVGNIDGSVFDGSGFGVYEEPIRNLARKYVQAQILDKADLNMVIQSVRGGKPVITWGLIGNSPPISWHTSGGAQVKVYPGEHARVVIGYTGDATNPDKLILLDPIYGKIRMDPEDFLAQWSVMNNRAVVIY